MSHRMLIAVYAIAAVAATLSLLALAQPDPANFAYHWYWSNDSVGNFADDATLAALGGWKIVKEWRAKKARDAKADQHQAAVIDHLERLHAKTDRIHAHLGIRGD